MPIRTSWRALVSYATAAVLALPFLGAIAATPVAHAANDSLTLTEINWAGSPKSASDTWVEIYNTGNTFTATATTPLTFCAAGSAVFSLSSGTVLPNSYLLVRNSAITSDTNSTLNASTFATATAVDLSTLPTVATDLQLVEGTCAAPSQVLDSVQGENGASAPFMGQNGTNGVWSSMQRIAANGDLTTSWLDSASDRVVGRNFDSAVTSQYGTPGTDRIRLTRPTNVTVTPDGNAAFGTQVTISGTVDPTTYAIELINNPHGLAADKQVLFPAVPVTPDAHAHFSVTTTVPTMTDGVYDFYVRALDGALSDLSDRSALSVLSTELMGGNVYVIYPNASTLAAPQFDQTGPLYTQDTAFLLKGTATGAAKVTILKNGEYYATVSVVSDRFGLNVLLTPNSQNVFTAMAGAADGTTFSTLATPLTVWQDNTAPAALNAADVTVTYTATGAIATLTGNAGAVTVNPNDGILTVTIYADAAKTQVLAGPVTVNSDGSFPTITLPTSSAYSTVYGTVKDQAGNESAVTSFTNSQNLGGTNSPLNPQVVSVTQTTATLSWSAVTGAKYYLVKYKTDGGTYTTAMAQCQTTTCSYQVSITGLNPGTTYIFAIAAVDAYGNVSNYTELPFTTQQPAPTVTTATSPTAPLTPVTASTSSNSSANSSSSSSTSTATPAPTPTTTPTPTPTATPDTGQVKSASTDNTRNWTPWIILAVLLAIAVLATAGYFYWFGGDAGEAAMAASLAAKERTDAKQAATKSGSSPNKKDTKSKSNDKRW